MGLGEAHDLDTGPLRGQSLHEGEGRDAEHTREKAGHKQCVSGPAPGPLQLEAWPILGGEAARRGEVRGDQERSGGRFPLHHPQRSERPTGLAARLSTHVGAERMDSATLALVSTSNEALSGLWPPWAAYWAGRMGLCWLLAGDR